MQLVKRQSGWWIVAPTLHLGAYGPYRTRDDAEEDRRGMQRTFAQRGIEPPPIVHPGQPVFEEEDERPRVAVDPPPAPAPERFTLAPPPPPKPRPAEFESRRLTQRVLLCGMDCLAGQMDLFPTDGGRAEQ